MGIASIVSFEVRRGATLQKREKARVPVNFAAIVKLGHNLHSPDDLRRAFEAVRRMVIGGLLEHRLDRVKADDRIELCLAEPNPRVYWKSSDYGTKETTERS